VLTPAGDWITNRADGPGSRSELTTSSDAKQPRWIGDAAAQSFPIGANRIAREADA
jgi:hypothetical protein